MLQGLRRGDLGTAGLLGAWEGLAQLEAQQGNWRAALAAAKKGLGTAAAAGQGISDAALLGNAPRHVARQLRLVMGLSLRELGQEADAVPLLSAIAGGNPILST